MDKHWQLGTADLTGTNPVNYLCERHAKAGFTTFKLMAESYFYLYFIFVNIGF